MGSGDVKEKIQNKTFKWIICIYVAAILFAAYFFILSLYGVKNTDFRNLRIVYKYAVQYAEDSEYDKLNKYECAIIDENSTVIYTNSNSYKLGDVVNLHSLSTGNMEFDQFVSPLVRDKKCFGTLVIKVDNKEVTFDKSLLIQILVLCFYLIIITLLCINLQQYIRKRVVNMINITSDVAEEILMENYDRSLKCNSKNEIGKLFEKLERLRDEIKNKNIQAQKMHENEKVVLASISHDLKTPIATISGCAESIKDGIARTQEDIQRYAGIILNKSRLLTKLIDEIIEHTDSEMEEVPLNKQEIYAKELMEKIYKRLLLDVKGLELKMGDVPNLLLYVSPEHIFRVFQNIVGNSVKYTPEGGVISIEFNQYNRYLEVDIEDNGQGINAEDIPFIFDRFYRGEKARTQKDISGSGLGLSIVKNIIERHGGRVECDSILGKGTIIRFSIPIY